MTDVITGEYSRWRSNLVDAHRLLKVAVWDTGPERPVKPAKPVPPKAPHGSIEADIAAIELKEAIANYDAQLAHYIAQLKDHDAWHARHSGPVILEMWSCDWKDAARHDTTATAEGRQHRRRYYRYDPRAQHQGLPVGTAPGRSHAEQIERRAAADQALEVAQASDPEFGSY